MTSWAPAEEQLLIDRVCEGVKRSDIAKELGKSFEAVCYKLATLRAEGFDVIEGTRR